MKRNYYIFTPGKLRRKDDTIFFQPFAEVDPQEDENLQDDVLLSIDSDAPETEAGRKTVIPVQDVSAFYIMAETSFNSKFLDFLTKNEIPMHVFNYYGYYSGSYYPRESLVSGFLTVNQTEHYLDPGKRMTIARKFVEGASTNILKNLKYYDKRERDCRAQIDTIESVMPEIKTAGGIQELMNVEGRIRKIYYSAFNEILTAEMKFDKRKFRPPTNPINAMISFCNAMVYTTVLAEIYRTQLNPVISFLHEPGQRRFSLALDMAEIFKPILSDRIIFKLVNSRAIQGKHFEKELNGHYLKENGRKKVVAEFDDKLKQTIKHRQIKRDVTYRRLVRLECYKLIKHLSGDKDYEPFKIWW